MQKKTAATVATLALVVAIAVTGVAAATIATPDGGGTGSAPVRSGTTSTVVQTTAATGDVGWQGQLPDANRFHDLSREDQQAVVTRVDRLIGDLRGSGSSAGLVAQLTGYRGEIEQLLR